MWQHRDMDKPKRGRRKADDLDTPMATSSRRAPVAAREAILRIRVAPAQLARWRTVADREYRSLSELAREAIEARVERTLRGSPPKGSTS